MPKYVAIKSERSLRLHKAAGAEIQWAHKDADLGGELSWFEDSMPYETLREVRFKEALKLRAVYKDDEQ